MQARASLTKVMGGRLPYLPLYIEAITQHKKVVAASICAYLVALLRGVSAAIPIFSLCSAIGHTRTAADPLLLVAFRCLYADLGSMRQFLFLHSYMLLDVEQSCPYLCFR